jgi:hypothetical protein
MRVLRLQSRAAPGVALAGVAAATVLSACGAGAQPRPSVCKLKSQNAIARYLDIAPGTISYSRSIGNNAMPQCNFRTRVNGRRLGVSVNVDDGSQPYFRLLRTVSEATQIFGPPPPGFRAPQQVSGLGPFASWFPNDHWLMATNDKVLVTVTVTWPEQGRDREVALAKTAIEPYVVRLKGHRNTKDFP